MSTKDGKKVQIVDVEEEPSSEEEIDKNKSFKAQIPYLKVSHKIKNKVISINNVIDNNNNKQNLNKAKYQYNNHFFQRLFSNKPLKK